MPMDFAMGSAMTVKLLLAKNMLRPDADRIGMLIMPPVTVNESELIYERPNVSQGLQFARGWNGSPGAINMPSIQSWRVSPGVYGDKYGLEERMLTDRRAPGSWFDFDSTGEISKRVAANLEKRFKDRIEYSNFQMLLTGGFASSNKSGTPLDTQVYDINQYTPGTLFTDLANSKPFDYLREVTWQQNRLGYATDFRKGQYLMSSGTLQTILRNTNPADIGGKRLEVGSTVNDVGGFNKLLLSNMLPEIVVYDAGFYPDTLPGTPLPPLQLFIPEGKILLLGKRVDGSPIGAYRLTRNARSELPDKKTGDALPLELGFYVQTVDYRLTTDRNAVDIIMGHNGGPTPEYPEIAATINAY